MVYDPNCLDKNLVRGDSRRYRFTVREPETGSNQAPKRINLNGATVTFTMKKASGENRFQPVADPAVVKTSDDATEVVISDQNVAETEGQFVVILRPTDTRFLDPGTYVYDAQVTTSAGDVYTVARGRIFLKADMSAAEDLTPP